MPNEFMTGAELATNLFFKELLNQDAAQGENRLQRFLTKPLFEAFHQQHKNFAENNLEMNFKLHSLENIRKGRTWMTFGDAFDAKSTLNQAPILYDCEHEVYWRLDPNDLKRKIFSELNFEYVFKSERLLDDLENEPPTLSQRGETTRKGAM